MSEIRDPAIKLFGQTIGLTQESGFLNQKHYFSSTTSNEDKITLQGEFTLSEQENELNDLTEDSLVEPDASLVEPEASSDISDGTKIQDADKETSSPKSTKNEDPDDEKVLKKPEKLLPCPRCNSMETKFCYYNNYNVNQPRYFCKKCQRYWTAGGTMRNVPVGSGRRKNKSCSISNYHHLNVSDARVEAALRANGSVLRFGSDKPLCDSMVSALNLAEKSQNIIANGFHGPEQRLPAYDQSNGPCSTSEKEKNSGTQDLNWKNFQLYHPQVPYYPAPPWACTWSTPQWRSMVQPSAINPSGFPVSFYPAPPYWINVPWPSSTPSSDNTGSPTLGKHSRDGSLLNPSQSVALPEREGERSVLIPKTLRIDDPDEAAKSSIWSTLGIKNDKADSIRGLRLFKAFNTKADHSNHEADSSLLLQANPAAFSRSLKFRERTQ